MPRFFKTLLWACALSLLLRTTWQTIHTHYTTTPALDVWALSVGQGESVFLREAGGKKILFDGGPDDTVQSELASIMPIWDHHIDLVILSHNHLDHITGLLGVIKKYSISEVWISGATEPGDTYALWRKELQEEHIPTKIVYAHFKENLGTLQLQVLHPTYSMDGVDPPNQHDATVVVKVTYAKESLLLTGDLDEGHEKDIIQHCLAPSCSLTADVLQIPHHGSATGLSPEFLQAVHPKAAFICVGQNNSYHHPRQEILERLNHAGVPFFRTDQDGQIHIVLYPDHITYEKVAGSTPR